MSSPPEPPQQPPQSEPGPVSINSLHLAVLREIESDSLLEIDSNFYRDLAGFIGDLQGHEFDGVQERIKGGMVDMATELASLLLQTRMEKASRAAGLQAGSLLDEEKFILDSQEEQAQRQEVVVSAVVSGRTKFLESLARGHKTARIAVRLLKDVDALMGADLERYGPFKAGDAATIPYENALALIGQSAAARIRWQDD